MQDGTAEINLPDGTWRMTRDAMSGELRLAHRNGTSLTAEREP
jgi:hypothetical protein